MPPADPGRTAAPPPLQRWSMMACGCPQPCSAQTCTPNLQRPPARAWRHPAGVLTVSPLAVLSILPRRLTAAWGLLLERGEKQDYAVNVNPLNVFSGPIRPSSDIPQGAPWMYCAHFGHIVDCHAQGTHPAICSKICAFRTHTHSASILSSMQQPLVMVVMPKREAP